MSTDKVDVRDLSPDAGWTEHLKAKLRYGAGAALHSSAGRAAGEAAFALRDLVLPLDASIWAASAERATGFSDWDPEAKRYFHECADLAASQDRLSLIGRGAMRGYYEARMKNHLRVRHLLAEHPEIRAIEVAAPIFVTGWYRTGTTLLHTVLGEDPAHRIPLTWELTLPVPGSGDPQADARARYAETHATFQWNDVLIPEQRVAHHITPDVPEECFFLLENAGVSTTMFNTFQGFDYAFELLERDLRFAYRSLREQMQIMTWDFERRGHANARSLRWVMKCPWHLWNLDTLLSVFPDARVVWTHRDPLKSLASNCSLSAITTGAFSRDPVDKHAMGAFWTKYFRLGADLALRAREEHGDAHFFDVALPALMRDPAETMRALYAHWEMPYEDALDARFTGSLQRDGRQPKGAHAYSPEEFGLDPSLIHARFEDIETRFLR